MRAPEWIQFAALAALLIVSTPIVGAYMAKVYSNGRAPGDRVFGPIERLIYRICGIDPRRRAAVEDVRDLAALVQRRRGARRLLRAAACSRTCPSTRRTSTAVPPFMALNTSVSFVTNTDWQSYIPESTVSHLTQMTVLGVQNFLSAAIGLTVAVALIRGLARRRSSTIGSFWVDLVRSCVRILLPAVARARGRVPEPGRDRQLPRQHAVQARRHRARAGQGRERPAHRLRRRARRAGRVAGGDQGARHQRRRLLQRQLRPPVREPERLHELLADVLRGARSASASRSRSGRWSATSARAGRSSR